MDKIFNLDNPIWNFLGKIVDMMLLTILWAVTSIPIVTIGASTTALYSVMLKLAQDKEGYVVRAYFGAFMENFKQSTIAWLIMLVIGIVLTGDLYICNKLGTSVAKMLFIAFVVIAIIYLMIITYLFPILAKCITTIKKAFFFAFMMSIKQFGWTILLIVIAGCVMAISVFVFWPVLVISVGLITYLQAIIFNNIFKTYNLE